MYEQEMHQRLIDRLKELQLLSNAAYYPWVKQLVTLSSGALTILVALQNNIVKGSPEALWLLQLALAGLFLSILLGVGILSDEWRLPLAAANNLIRTHKNHGLDEVAKLLAGPTGVQPSHLHRTALRALPMTFAGSLGLLMTYAIVNI